MAMATKTSGSGQRQGGKPAASAGASTSGPILNGPYDEPLYHYATAPDGNLDYRDRRPGRRIFAPDTPQVPLGQSLQDQAGLYDLNDFAPNYRDYLVNLLRSQLGEWRAQGYPGVTSRVTRDLLAYWFQNPQRPDHQRLFFAQREAVEAAIWLNEVADKSNPGTHILNELRKAQASVDDRELTLPRIAFKMATGTGKTVVMACLIVYHFLNRQTYANDPKYADYFLLVAPGVTIRDRLAVLRVDTEAAAEHLSADYYGQRKLVPPTYAGLMRGLNARLAITNFHGFEPRLIGGNKKSPLDGKLGPDGRKVEAREDETGVLRRLLPSFKAGRRLLVLNDEAHHCYLPRARGRDGDDGNNDATENERAAVWYSGLRALARRWQVRAVYDLSATPYYLAGSGWPAYSYFPWIVSDFSLIEAIEAGLVKIPFLPVDDSAQHIEEPVLKNLYEHCRDELPRKGQRTQRSEAAAAATPDATARGGKKAKPAVAEPPPQVPSLLRNALAQFYRHYENYERGQREAGERGGDLLTSPPVFIVVCSNTTVSKEVYKHIAGYETTDADGRPLAVPGVLPVFSNFDPHTRVPRQRPPTLLIDSDALEHSGQVDDDFKRVFAPEIESFKRDYRLSNPAKSVDGLTDADLLREVVNTVGRPGKLGQHIRCVVSVGMLTEGWDANTVSHIVGVRAFGSQLLCEQVAGRALRRRQYFVDPKTGRFPPEYAHIIGVPFRFFQGGEAEPAPPRDVRTIKALPERAALEISFPRLVGYKLEHGHDRLDADFDGCPPFRLDLTVNPAHTDLGTAFSAERSALRQDLDSLRDQQVVWWVASQVLSRYYRGDDGRVQMEHFGDLRRIAAAWYAQQIDLVGERDARHKRLVMQEDARRVAASVFLGIEQAAKRRAESANNAASRGPVVLPLLNHHNPVGSTAHVFGSTTKPVFDTTKSHVNRVVADTDRWEQIAARTLEKLSAIESYVKNAFLGFEVPYVDAAGAERRYLPDFIARICTPGGQRLFLIVEVTGFARDKTEKRYFMRERWLPAVNAHQQMLRTLPWHFIEITDIDRVKEQLEAEIERLAAEVDGTAAPAVKRSFEGPSAWDVFQLMAALPDEAFEGLRNPAPRAHRPGLLDDDDF
jgi:type III restriction enzyme